jgi:hypothetical protein
MRWHVATRLREAGDDGSRTCTAAGSEEGCHVTTTPLRAAARKEQHSNCGGGVGGPGLEEGSSAESSAGFFL